MTPAQLIRQYERLRLDAERVGATAPLAQVYAAFIEELRSVGGIERVACMMTTHGGGERTRSEAQDGSQLVR